MVQILTGPRLARALRAGALAVAREQETLNRINVFPVPDADTGANLASTLRAAAAALTTPNELTVGQTARTAADAALDGARGNSGAIFAQFLHGMAEAIGSRVSVTTREFAAAARRGADSAQQALSQPVDGTILSVVKAWAAGLEEQTTRIHDFGELLSRALVQAREALANTPKQLAVLAKHGVVDAGGQGFVYFLEGVSTLMRDRNAASWRRAGLSLAQPTPFAAAHADLDLAYRFCSEGLLSGNQLDRKAVARAVEPLGGSLVVAGGGSRLRVHLHTNEPQRLFTRLAEFGTVERTKIDDMVLQQLAAREATVAVVTDSSCDLSEATSHAIGLVRVPLTVSFGEETFTDGVDITPPQFYQRLASSPAMPKTSQPAVGEFRSTFQRLLETHEAVISVNLSSGVSGTYQAAAAAAQQVDPAASASWTRGRYRSRWAWSPRRWARRSRPASDSTTSRGRREDQPRGQAVRVARLARHDRAGRPSVARAGPDGEPVRSPPGPYRRRRRQVGESGDPRRLCRLAARSREARRAVRRGAGRCAC